MNSRSCITCGNMTDTDAEDTDSDSSDESSEEKSKVKIRAHDLEVKAESTESFETIMDRCSEQMDEIMRQSMRGELEVLEERDAHFILGGEP